MTPGILVAEEFWGSLIKTILLQQKCTTINLKSYVLLTILCILTLLFQLVRMATTNMIVIIPELIDPPFRTIDPSG